MGQSDGAEAAARWRQFLTAEREAAELYTRLAAAESGERREIFRELADIERRHAAHWEASSGPREQ